MAQDLACLVHEIDKAKEITYSGFLSAMQRPSGVNFSVRVIEAFRPFATN